MSLTRLLIQSLRHHWRTNLSVLLGCLVGTAVLTGALLVGDSMRGSLRDMTLERLGQIDHALIGTHFFGRDLSRRMLTQGTGGEGLANAAAVILIRGSVSRAEGQVARQVNLIGTTPQFWQLFPSIGAADRLSDQVVANTELARELEATPGDRLIVRMEKASSIPREGLMGDRDETVRAMPVIVDRVIETRGVGRFSLETTQRLPKNLYVPLAKLAQVIEQDGRANALLAAAGNDQARQAPKAAQTLLKRAMTLSDYGLTLRPCKEYGYVSVENRRRLLEPRIERAVIETARALAIYPQPTLAYLANTIAVGERQVPYSIITAVDPGPPPSLGPLATVPPGLELKADDILLNRWTADQLKAKIGDRVRLDYYQVTDTGDLETLAHTFRLAGIVSMQGLALDRGFTPEYPGITDADHFGDWDPPFPIDLKRIRQADEDYWDKYRATPKGFVRLHDGQQLWSSRFGRVTSIRLAGGGRQGLSGSAGTEPTTRVPLTPEAPQQLIERFQPALLETLQPADVGLVFEPIKHQDLTASEGSTDFGGLFIAFSSFLIASAALLVGLLFRLNTERRAGQIGILLAVGVGVRQTRRLLLMEGLLLAGLGGLLGLFGAVGYAALMIDALTSWWQAAVSTPFIELHCSAVSFLIGGASSVAVAMIAIWWAVRHLGQVAIPRLLMPGFTYAMGSAGRETRGSQILAIVGFLGGIGMVAGAHWMDPIAAFFSAAALLLVGALALLSVMLRLRSGSLVGGSGISALFRLGMRNAGRYPSRSVLTVGLIAFATFVIVAVGAMRHGHRDDVPRKDSGNGGFSLVAESATPIYRDLGSERGRFDLAVSDDASRMLVGRDVFQFRVRAGDDASCLNIYQPKNPTLLGAPRSFIKRGGFAFAATMAQSDAERANPWLLLDRRFEDGAIPAIGDANALQWIVKVGVGHDLEARDELGRPIQLRIVASLKGNLFQGELFIAETRFKEEFPSLTGDRFFLLETPPQQAEKLAATLERDLADYGFDAVTTRQRVVAFKAVENTYMATFQTIGGLGLLLGTLGLGTVLLRNVLERRAELALLRAVGFRKLSLGLLVLAENLLLLVIGLVIGTGCALIAVLPQLVHMTDFSQLIGLAGILLGVLVAGTLSGLVAVIAALRTPLLTALRAE